MAAQAEYRRGGRDCPTAHCAAYLFVDTSQIPDEFGVHAIRGEANQVVDVSLV